MRDMVNVNARLSPTRRHVGWSREQRERHSLLSLSASLPVSVSGPRATLRLIGTKNRNATPKIFTLRTRRQYVSHYYTGFQWFSA